MNVKAGQKIRTGSISVVKNTFSIMPIHPVTMTKWRNRLGSKSGSEKLLIETIKAGLKIKP